MMIRRNAVYEEIALALLALMLAFLLSAALGSGTPGGKRRACGRHTETENATVDVSETEADSAKQRKQNAP